MTGPWLPLVEAAGGVGELADALGVTRNTVYAWGTGRVEAPPLRRQQIEDWARRRKLASPFAS